MPDMEKVLYELKHQIADADWCDNDWKDNVPIWMLRDALALLKEQEGVKPIWQLSPKDPWFYCGACKKELTSEQFLYCPWCGRKVKWDD